MLIGQDVVLRALEREDLEDLQRWWNDADLTRRLGTRRHLTTLAETEAWFDSQLEQVDAHSGRTYAIAERGDTKGTKNRTPAKDRLIGTIWYGSFTPQDRNVEVGLYLASEGDRGRGLGRQALGLLVEYLFDDLAIHKVRLLVEAENERALRCYEDLGFLREGLLRHHRFFGGRHHDFIPMALLATERNSSRRS